MTETTGATCPTCTSVLPAGGMPCPRCSAGPYGAPTGPQAGYRPVPPQYAPPQYAPPQFAPYQQMPYPSAPQLPVPFPGAQYPPMPHQPAPYATRPAKSAGVAVLLTLLWIGAGHLYLDRIGTGLALMGAHFVLGFLLFVIFFPLGFVAWLAAVVVCCVWCSNLAGQINAGTVPPRETW